MNVTKYDLKKAFGSGISWAFFHTALKKRKEFVDEVNEAIANNIFGLNGKSTASSSSSFSTTTLSAYLGTEYFGVYRANTARVFDRYEKLWSRKKNKEEKKAKYLRRKERAVYASKLKTIDVSTVDADTLAMYVENFKKAKETSANV